MVASHTADLVALGALVSAYAHHVDARDIDAVGALFVDDAVLRLPAPPETLLPVRTVVGREAIVAELAALEAFAVTSHLVQGHHVVTIDDQTAHAVTRGEAHHISQAVRTGEWRDLVWVIRYDDVYAKTSDGWRFAERALTIDIVETRPVKQALLPPTP